MIMLLLAVRLIAVDGMSWEIIAPMMERGELPAFARLIDHGLYDPDFGTVGRSASPEVWTTVATGRAPASHGVRDFIETNANGNRIPITSNARRVPALWNIVPSVGVINWWATWPAESVRGYVVSDIANPAYRNWMRHDKARYMTEPETPSRTVFPASLKLTWGAYEPVSERVPRNAETWFRVWRMIDGLVWEQARNLWSAWPRELEMVYLRGPDPVQHYAWGERVDLIEGVYSYIDSWIGAALDDHEATIVLSDHGAEPCPPGSKRPGCHKGDVPGVLFILGAGHGRIDATPYDIAPTVAALLGVPVSRELRGRVLVDVDSVAYVDSWQERDAGTEPEGVPAQVLEALKSLGYIH